MLHKVFVGNEYILIKCDGNYVFLGYYAASSGIATNRRVMELLPLAA